VYLLVFIIGTVGLSLTGLDFETALGASASCLGNVGPAIGKLHPSANFSIVSIEGKWICSLLMILGRLELFTILILFSRSFWRVN
jgi:trk system potassium uptake protein TrkH